MEETFQGYVFMNDTDDNNLRVLCQEDDTLCLKEWNADLDNSTVLIFWFYTSEGLKNYLKYSIIQYRIPSEVQELIQNNKLFAISAEKNGKTGEISII